jgi:hypothetical protein
MYASSNFSGSVSRILIDVVNGYLEGMSVFWVWKGGRIGSCSRCEEVGFDEGKFNAKRFAKFGKFVEDGENVSIGSCCRCVIHDGGGVSLGAKGVIIRLLIVETSEFRSFMKKGVNFFEEDGESMSR